MEVAFRRPLAWTDGLLLVSYKLSKLVFLLDNVDILKREKVQPVNMQTIIHEENESRNRFRMTEQCQSVFLDSQKKKNVTDKQVQ